MSAATVVRNVHRIHPRSPSKERQVSNDDHFWTVALLGLLVWGTIVVSLVAVLT